MPAGTEATVKGVLARDLIGDLDAKIILGNTYHLYLRPGPETVRRLGGLHRFMAWPRAILTDSGGFQVFSLDSLRKVTEEVSCSARTSTGDAHMFTPESTIDVQMALGAVRVRPLPRARRRPAGLLPHRQPLDVRRPAGSSPTWAANPKFLDFTLSDGFHD